MKTCMLIFALAVGASPAFAGSLVETRDCRYSGFYGNSHCTWTSTYIPTPVRDFEQEKIDAIAQAKEDAKWDAFCQPSFRTDQYGVRRAAYVKQGCDVGRSE